MPFNQRSDGNNKIMKSKIRFNTSNFTIIEGMKATGNEIRR